MLSEISKRRLKYLGHVNRNTKTNLMTTVLQGVSFHVVNVRSRRSSLISFCLYFALQHGCHQVCFCVSIYMTKVLEPSFADLREHKTLYTKFFQDTFIRSFVSPFNMKQSSVKPHFYCLVAWQNRRWYSLITSGKTREYLENSKLEF
jgi:hypothetical protein